MDDINLTTFAENMSYAKKQWDEWDLRYLKYFAFCGSILPDSDMFLSIYEDQIELALKMLKRIIG